MKTTIPFVALAMVGLSLTPIHASDATATKSATEMVAGDKIPVYVVVVSGKGWGVGAKASSAIKKQDGVKTVLMSGYRATVIMKDGKSLDETSTKKAIVGSGIQMTSFGSSETVVPAAAYQLKVAGGGWSITADKARVALEKIDGVTAAYVDKNIDLHFAEGATFDKDKIATLLKPYKLTVQDAKKLEALPF